MIEEKLGKYLREALEALSFPADIPIPIERPRDESYGDYATPVAFSLAKHLRKKPHSIASEIKGALKVEGDAVEEVTIAGSGYINFRLTKRYFVEQLHTLLNEGSSYGSCDLGKGQKVMVEFVSSNPTGPLTVGHGRQAALGDVLSNILREAGFQVTREYYFNDAGRQMDLLGQSCYARYMQEFEPSFEFPEDGYKGEYLIEIAKKAVLEFGERYTEDREEVRLEALQALRKYASGEIVAMIDADLKEMGIVFDSWFNESSLFTDGKVDETIEMLRKADVLYDKDGALWFKASEHGDEEDRVLIKSTGHPTYFMTDIAYHIDKYKREFPWMINIHGADHHGYVPRMKAAMKALGFKEDSLRYLVHQMVSFIEGGVKMKMSTRAGAFVTLKELMDKVGVDATRYFFVMRKADSHLVFDIDIAKKQTDENPVYYVQYVHARIANILTFAEKSGLDVSERSLVDGSDMEKIVHDEEWSLIKKLTDFPTVLKKSAIHLEPHRLTAYLEEVAAAFHNWYQNHRVVTDDRTVSTSRLLIAVCTRNIIARGLDLLGVSKPDRM